MARILIRNLAINYIVSDPVIPQGEFALELDTNKVKLGDGITKWNDLTYFGTGGGSSTGLILTAPNGDKYNVTVDNNGYLTLTKQ
jgi:hypothetical protein